MKQDVCKAWVARDEAVIARCQHLSYFPLVVERAQGAEITDADGNTFIDFLASASSLNLGSCNPVLTEAIETQMRKCTQYTAAYCYNAPMVEYAERLVSTYPGGVRAKVCFGNCGSDANDAAVKFSRAFTGRKKIISFINGYHGNTYGSSSLTFVTPRMRDGMGPFLPEVYSFPFFGVDVDDETCERDCLADMQRAFDTYLSPEEVAAVIIEPLQGDGGLLPAHPIFLQKLYALCKQHGILFISEEVQQAFYRTGKMFGIEHYEGIVPDGIVMGKSIGASLTLGAFMARAEIIDCLPAPAHLFTMGGNALACAAGKAGFDYMCGSEFQGILARNCTLLAQRAQQLKEKHGDVIGFVRGLGMSYGMGVVRDGKADLDATFKILFRAYEYGLLIISVAGNILRVQPPLNITEEQLNRGFDIVDQAILDLKAGKIPDDVLRYRAGW